MKLQIFVVHWLHLKNVTQHHHNQPLLLCLHQLHPFVIENEFKVQTNNFNIVVGTYSFRYFECDTDDATCNLDFNREKLVKSTTLLSFDKFTITTYVGSSLYSLFVCKWKIMDFENCFFFYF